MVERLVLLRMGLMKYTQLKKLWFDFDESLMHDKNCSNYQKYSDSNLYRLIVYVSFYFISIDFQGGYSSNDLYVSKRMLSFRCCRLPLVVLTLFFFVSKGWSIKYFYVSSTNNSNALLLSILLVAREPPDWLYLIRGIIDEIRAKPVEISSSPLE